MITAVRLLPRNPKRGHKLRTYVSATSRIRYKAGEGSNPSPWRIVSDPNELKEVQQNIQFETKNFKTVEELENYVQVEMEDGARLGKPPIRAQIEGQPAFRKEKESPKLDLSILENEQKKDDDVETEKPDVEKKPSKKMSKTLPGKKKKK